MLDPRRLSYFLAVAAERSFTRAAERLHIAQPALSRQVRLLEEELGGPLLIRGGTDGVTTTPAGALLVERAPELLRQLELLGQDARGIAGTRARAAGTLRFGYGTSAAHTAAPRILCALHEQHPEVVLDARVIGNTEAVAALHAGELDAALLRLPVGTEGLSTTVLRHERQGVMLEQDHPLAAHAAVPVAALAEFEIVIHPRAANPGRYDAIVATCEAAGFTPHLVEPLLAFDPTHSMVTGNGRTTFVSDPATVIPDGLVWRPVAPGLVVDVVLVTPLVASPPAVALLQSAELVAQEAGWLAGGPAAEPLAA